MTEITGCSGSYNGVRLIVQFLSGQVYSEEWQAEHYILIPLTIHGIQARNCSSLMVQLKVLTLKPGDQKS